MASWVVRHQAWHGKKGGKEGEEGEALQSQLAISLCFPTFGTNVGGTTARVIGEVLWRCNQVAIALRS